MSSRTIQCLHCGKLARVERSAPARQWSLTWCNACYEQHGGASKARAPRGTGTKRTPKRTPRPRETVEQGGGLYSASDDRPAWQSGLTDLERIQAILRGTPGAEGDEIPCQRPGCEARASFPAGADPGRIQRGWCESCWAEHGSKS
jgi:hypothetical protein